MSKLGWRIIPFVLFLLLCVFLWRGLFLDPHRLPSAQIGKPLPQFSLQQLNHSNTNFTPKDLHHNVVLLNIWASWCSSCAEEQAFLMRLAHDGVLIYGLNYKDKKEDALHWLAQWGNPYQLIGQDREGKVAIDLGVYGTPETFLIDKKGIIRYRHAGVMNQEQWEKIFVPLIKTLEQS